LKPFHLILHLALLKIYLDNHTVTLLFSGIYNVLEMQSTPQMEPYELGGIFISKVPENDEKGTFSVEIKFHGSEDSKFRCSNIEVTSVKKEKNFEVKTSKFGPIVSVSKKRLF